ncbi:hypothetical protein SAMN05660860_01277 [Geoalkalibacter ferrihydriticus]|uniref:Uncharacterized protein n=2 Tax=Geoalkalibacter ferrihydriticus TaxID=392333 RepID=A0A0C2HSJ2_9BACT|nr:hypothetical protein [Geoalkalibacter ferrihydriticus]KIH77780.1 hypothetical protein GFER_03800 [Geoalkalibacter ferrihydriticus DSM 17813]SDL78622.1 hypothetical protein SAMN05660860_01277 [Geoalkalibacter ferrihydriticus]
MKTMIKPLGIFFVLTLLAGCGGSSGSGTTTQVGTLEVGGAGLAIDQMVDDTGTPVTADFSVPIDINDSFEVIGYAALAANSPFVAALWEVNADGAASVAPVALETLGGYAAAFAIDEFGNAVGQAADGDRLAAVLWTNGGTTVQTLQNLPNAPATATSKAYGISADGTLIVGEAQDATVRTRGVFWIADGQGNFGAAQVLPFAAFAVGGEASRFSSASGVAKVGSGEILVVGEAEAGDLSMRAALWRSTNNGATFTAINLGTDHLAYAVNENGLVVGESDLVGAPVMWTVTGGVVSGPVALGTAGSAVAVNENGRIAGWTGDLPRATLWSGTAPATLFNTASEAYGLNNDTQPLVVGREGSKGFVKRVN